MRRNLADVSAIQRPGPHPSSSANTDCYDDPYLMNVPVLPVTVVIAAYNREDTVARAVLSVRAQTSLAAEIIVVDDASTDRTAEVAERAGAKVIRLADNGGAARARNAGIAAAVQPWIAFLDSDDEWLPGQLSTLWPYHEHHSLITGASIVLDEATGIRRRNGVRRDQVLESPVRLVFPDNFVSSGGVLVSRMAPR